MGRTEFFLFAVSVAVVVLIVVFFLGGPLDLAVTVFGLKVFPVLVITCEMVCVKSTCTVSNLNIIDHGLDGFLQIFTNRQCIGGFAVSKMISEEGPENQAVTSR